MIAHVDADAFFASVLQRKHPKLRGKPLLALGMGGGCVIAASYEAKAKGVKTGMRLADARKLCRGAVEMPSDFEETAVASRQIASVLEEQCPVMEQMSVDEWFLDLRLMQGGLPDNLFRWAEKTQKNVLQRVGISVSAGIAHSKLLAKMASEYHKPAGVTLITKQNLEAFLRDRPAAAIPGIGRRRSLHAEANRWQTAWDVATADQEQIQRLFGKQGREMQLELLGTSVYGVEENAGPPKSVSRCRSFRTTENKERIFSSILDHLSYTVLKMRRHGLMCRELCVWLRDGEYRHDGRNIKLPQPMDTEEQMLPYVRECFAQLYEKTPRCTQTGLALCNLRSKGSLQFSLFEDAKHAGSSEQMQEKLDELHERFGRSSILRGSALPTKSAGKPHLHILG
ncbi:MAG TPA: DNA polymerase IV [Candidatus Peribacteraceae bacterium]|nr:DNA polymerase IV [Candidatus Peribacteraceae bacterium]